MINVKIQQKMIYTFMVIIFIFLASIGISIFGINQLKEGVVDRIPSIRSRQEEIIDIQLKLQKIHVMQLKMVETGNLQEHEYMNSLLNDIESYTKNVSKHHLAQNEKLLLQHLYKGVNQYKELLNGRIIPEVEVKYEKQIKDNYRQYLRLSVQLLDVEQKRLNEYVMKIEAANEDNSRLNKQIDLNHRDQQANIEKIRLLTQEHYSLLQRLEQFVEEQQNIKILRESREVMRNDVKYQGHSSDDEIFAYLGKVEEIYANINKVIEQLNSNDDEISSQLVNNTSVMRKLLGDIQSCTQIIDNTYRGISLLNEYVILREPQLIQNYYSIFNQNEVLLNMLSADEGTADQIKKWQAQLHRNAEHIEKAVEHINENILGKESEKAERILGQCERYASDLEKAFGSYLHDTVRISEDTEENIIFVVAIVTVLAVILGILAAMLLSRSIVKPIHHILKALSDIEAGKMFIKNDLSRRDEIGELASRLKQLLITQHTMCDEVAASSIHIHSTAESLEQFFYTTKNNISKMVNDVLELFSRHYTRYTNHAARGEKSKSIQENMDSHLAQLQKVKSLGQKVQASFVDSSSMLQDAQNIMHEVTASIDDTVGAMDELKSASEQIKKMSETITGIASKTNLLALNAAIEASRAGEAGKGFAVVADEVRKLADGSSKAAVEIKKLVEALNHKVEDSIGHIHTSVDKIRKSDERIEKTGKSIAGTQGNVEELVGSLEVTAELIHETKEFINELTNAFKELLETLDETIHSKDEINVQVQEFNQLVEEIQSVVSNLNNVSVSLEKIKKR